MSKDYISNAKEFKNYMLGITKDLHEKINFNPMSKDEEKVVDLYTNLMNFVCNDCGYNYSTFNRSSFEYNGKEYPAIELYNFHTADNVDVDYGIFTTVDFMDLGNDDLEYRMLDDRVYGYLPKKLIETGTEEEIREFIKYEIG